LRDEETIEKNPERCSSILEEVAGWQCASAAFWLRVRRPVVNALMAEP
jgi:hypothetical protein